MQLKTLINYIPRIGVTVPDEEIEKIQTGEIVLVQMTLIYSDNLTLSSSSTCRIHQSAAEVVYRDIHHCQSML